MSYDKNNIFAKILRKEIPCKKIFEDVLKELEDRKKQSGIEEKNNR